MEVQHALYIPSQRKNFSFHASFAATFNNSAKSIHTLDAKLRKNPEANRQKQVIQSDKAQLNLSPLHPLLATYYLKASITTYYFSVLTSVIMETP